MSRHDERTNRPDVLSSTDVETYPNRDAPIPFAVDAALERSLAAAGIVPALVVDWSRIEPHPELAALDRICADCGWALGEHQADAPHACPESGCRGFRTASPALVVGPPRRDTLPAQAPSPSAPSPLPAASPDASGRDEAGR